MRGVCPWLTAFLFLCFTAFSLLLCLFAGMLRLSANAYLGLRNGSGRRATRSCLGKAGKRVEIASAWTWSQILAIRIALALTHFSHLRKTASSPTFLLLRHSSCISTSSFSRPGVSFEISRKYIHLPSEGFHMERKTRISLIFRCTGRVAGHCIGRQLYIFTLALSNTTYGEAFEDGGLWDSKLTAKGG